ncbi:MAG: hypothetical protein PVI90_13185 [Desulfobacteraceae bacterium]|jgi:hypothetical protein
MINNQQKGDKMTKKITRKKYEWKCPKCGAPNNACGEGECACTYTIGYCDGFVCECEDVNNNDDNVDEDHGLYMDNPCHNAACYHCGWTGRFPPKPKKSMNDRMIKRVVTMLVRDPNVLMECDSKALATKIVNYVSKTILAEANK